MAEKKEKSIWKSPGVILTLLFIAISLAFIAISYMVLDNLPAATDTGAIIVIIITIIIAYFVVTPIVIDIVGAYAFEYCRIEEILQSDEIKSDEIEKEKVYDLLKQSMKGELSGVRNLTRAMIALSIILIIGVAVGFIILNIYNISYKSHTNTSYIQDVEIMKIMTDNDEKNMTILGNILGNILSILAGAISAITGFFFGSRNPERLESPSDQSDSSNQVSNKLNQNNLTEKRSKG